MSLLLELLAGAVETIRETLPGDTREVGVWLAGFCWAFALHWATLLLVTWIAVRGGTP